MLRILVASLVGAVAFSAQPQVRSVPKEGPFGVSAFTGIYSLPYLRTGIQTHEFTSYDRAGDNYDADYFPIYEEKNGEFVLFDSYGPGCLYRLHMNIWNGDLTGVRIRFYFDHEAKPRIDMDVTEFFSEKNPLGIFKSPYAHIGEGYRVLYHPFFFMKHLEVSLNKEPLGHEPGWDKLPWLGRYDKHPYRRNHWYEFTYHTYTENPGFKSWTKPLDMSAVAALWNPALIGKPPRRFQRAVAARAAFVLPGQTAHTALDLHQGATISELHFQVDPKAPSALFDTWLKITFDGSKEPQVEAPLGCFFGIYRTYPTKRIQSFFAGTKGEDLYCYFPMPFWKSAKVVLDNKGANALGVRMRAVIIKSPELAYPRERCGWFYAVYNRQAPRKEGQDYRYLNFVGRGQYVGHFAFRWNTSMEEDERTYFDGNRTPQLTGEGYEDDHNQGWGLKNLILPMWGCVAADGGSGAPWRFYVPELYVFQSAVRAGHQTYGPRSPLGHEGMYQVGEEESVAFLYARPTPNLELSDEVSIGSSTSLERHEYRVLGTLRIAHGDWWYDGEFNNVLFPVQSIGGYGYSTDKGSSFVVRIDPRNQGVRLRRRTDKENNRQLANVYVDGVLVKERPWYSVDFDRTFRGIRWFDTEFEIPAHYTHGKRKIRITIKPISSKTGRWDEFFYWVYCYK